MEKITNIEIKNFKSIKYVAMNNCKRINVFVGPPNVGKSNVLEALGLFMLGNINDVDLRELLRFENYSNLFYNNNFNTSIEINLDGNEKIDISIKKREVLVWSSSNKMSFKMQVPLDNFKINVWEHGVGSEGYDQQERLNIKKYSFKEEGEAFSLEYKKELDAPFGENLADVIKSNEEFKKEVIEIFRAYQLKYGTDENGKIRIVKEHVDQQVVIFPYKQMADTLRRLIFYKAAIACNRDTVLLFEEPESHMFPPYISKFTSDIIHDANNNQYFIATHSPYVLNDLMEDAREDLAIFLVDYKNGETLIHKMSDADMHEAYQFGYDFFLNMKNFMPTDSHEKV